MVSLRVPYAFDSRTRACGPPILTRAIIRTVWSRSAMPSVGAGVVVHVPTQRMVSPSPCLDTPPHYQARGGPPMVRWLRSTVLLIAALLSACGPTAPQAAPPTAPAASGQPTAASQPTSASKPTAAAGGQVRITLNQEPDSLNPMYSGLRATFTVTQTILEGLLVAGETGEYEPNLAAEVPSPQNGLVSADGMTITY